jgi:hypothetical protein
MIKSNKYQKKHWLRRLSVLKLNVVFVILWLAVAAGYLAVLNDMTANGYKMKKIESRLAGLGAENKDLGLNLSNKQSMERVMADVKGLGMTDSGSVTYLTMPSTVMVKK